MTINKNTKDIILAVSEIATSHSALASRQLETGVANADTLAAQLEMAMRDTQLAQEALMRLLQGNAVPEISQPVIPKSEAPAAPPAFKLKDTKVSAPVAEPVVTSPVVGDIAPPPFLVNSEKRYNVSLAFNKPCVTGTCPFAQNCAIRKKGFFNENCGVSNMKQRAMEGGEIAIEVVMGDDMRMSFVAYKGEDFIGHLALNKDTKDLVAVLEDYMGQRVFLEVQPREGKNNVPNSVFSLLSGIIVRHESLELPRSGRTTVPVATESLESFFEEEDYAVVTPFSI